jgi:WD40 repeat protein
MVLGYNVETGKKIFESKGHIGTVYGMAYHAGQHVYASAGDKTVRLWKSSDGASVKVIETISPAYVVQFTPDGSEMIVGCRDGKVRIYSTATWQLSDTLQSGMTVFNLAISFDGEYFVTGGDNGECLAWNLKKRALLYTLKGHTKWVFGVAPHPQLPYVVTAAYDRTAKIWNLRTGRCVLTLYGFTDPLYTVSVTKQGNRLILTQVNGTIHVVDISQQ